MQQTGRCRIRWAVRRFGEALDSQRSPDTHLFVEDKPGELAHAVKLAGATGQHQPTAGDLVRSTGLQTIAHHLEGLFDARRDDANKQRFRHMLGVTVFLFYVAFQALANLLGMAYHTKTAVLGGLFGWLKSFQV